MNEISIDPAALWLIVGIVLLLSEFIVPGLVIGFFGLGGLVVSAATYFGWVESTSSQLMLFTVSSLGSLFGLRWLVKSWFIGDSDKGSISDELSGIVGQEVVCLTDFGPTQKRGMVEFNGSNWKARCEVPLGAGDVGRIQAVDGLCLEILPAD